MNKITFLMLLTFSFVNSQELKEDEYIRNMIEKNMTFYRIFFSKNLDVRTCSEQIIHNVNYYVIDKDKNYDIEIIPLLNNLIYPKKEFKLLAVKNNYYLVKSKSVSNAISFTHSKPYEDLLSENMLIAFNETDNKIIFISGYLMKNCIANDFKLDIKNLDTFSYFLKLKLYNYEINDIVFVKKNRKKMLFKAFSKKLMDFVYIKIDPKNFDDLKIKTEKIKWTENGSFKWE